MVTVKVCPVSTLAAEELRDAVANTAALTPETDDAPAADSARITATTKRILDVLAIHCPDLPNWSTLGLIVDIRPQFRRNGFIPITPL
jgi:hypothetical protein